jgi:hypothetical protein
MRHASSQNNDNNEQDANETARVVSPAAAIRPGRQESFADAAPISSKENSMSAHANDGRIALEEDPGERQESTDSTDLGCYGKGRLRGIS